MKLDNLTAHQRMIALADRYDALTADLPEPHGPVTEAYKTASRDIRQALGADVVVSEGHMCELADRWASAGGKPCEACDLWRFASKGAARVGEIFAEHEHKYFNQPPGPNTDRELLMLCEDTIAELRVALGLS